MIAKQEDVQVVRERHRLVVPRDQTSALDQDVRGIQNKVAGVLQLQGSVDEEFVHRWQAVIGNDVETWVKKDHKKTTSVESQKGAIATQSLWW